MIRRRTGKRFLKWPIKRAGEGGRPAATLFKIITRPYMRRALRALQRKRVSQSAAAHTGNSGGTASFRPDREEGFFILIPGGAILRFAPAGPQSKRAAAE
ncbi:hypothetical protein A5N82_05495 [Christensenella minuta]|nr:hypothetical protein B1H56_12485 [Christensenella minuta]OAQ40137.1 hypothetical protein A5N82_05495 [Christensenella minuta]